MSWDYVQREKFHRSLWGRTKLAIWDFWTAWMDFFGINAGEMPSSWRKGT